jgi:hypothetical protein
MTSAFSVKSQALQKKQLFLTHVQIVRSVNAQLKNSDNARAVDEPPLYGRLP